MKLRDGFHKLSSMSPAAKASLVLMVTQMIQKGMQVITAPILTRLMDKAQYGQYSLFFSWYDILIIFTGLCLHGGVFNNGMLDYKEDRDVFSFSLYNLTFIVSCAIGIVTMLFCTYVWNFINLPLHLIVFMFVLLTFESALSLWTVRQRFEYKYKALAVITLSLTVLSPACGILGIVLFPDNAVTACIMFGRGVFLLFYLGILAVLARNAKGRNNTGYWKYALRFNLPLIPHYLSQHILNHMDRIQIAAIVGEASAGIYSLAYSGGAIVKLFWTSINASLIPWTYEQCEKKDFKRIDSLTRVLVLSYALVCLIVMFLAPEIMTILAPASYHEGIYVIPSVIIGVFFSAMYFIFANVVYYYKQPKYVMVGSCCSAVVNVALNAIFIPKFGYIAAGYTTAVSYILQSVIDYYAMRRVISEKIYDMRYIVGIAGSVVVIGIILNSMYGNSKLRYGLLSLLILFMFAYFRHNKAQFSALLKKRGVKQNNESYTP